MSHSIISASKGTTGIVVPGDVPVLRPSAGMPGSVASFFGENGRWWGHWRSPQVKGGYDAILIVREIVGDSEALIVYLVPDYPQWYVTATRWETTATFTTREDGKLVLRVPYPPAATTMDFWLKDREMKGIMYGRYMRSDIVMRPLV